MDTTTKLRVCLAARGKIPTRTQIPLDLETLFVAFAKHPERGPKYNEPVVANVLMRLAASEAEHSYLRTCARARSVIHAVVDWVLDPQRSGFFADAALRAALRDAETSVSFTGMVSRIKALPAPAKEVSLAHQLRIRALRVYAERAASIDLEDAVADQEAQAGFAAEVLLPVLPLHVLLRVLFVAARAHFEHNVETMYAETPSSSPGEGEGEGADSPRESWLENYRLHTPKPEAREFSVYGTFDEAVRHGGYPLAFDCILRWPLQNTFRMLGPPNLRYSAQPGPVLRWEHDPVPGRL